MMTWRGKFVESCPLNERQGGSERRRRGSAEWSQWAESVSWCVIGDRQSANGANTRWDQCHWQRRVLEAACHIRQRGESTHSLYSSSSTDTWVKKDSSSTESNSNRKKKNLQNLQITDFKKYILSIAVVPWNINFCGPARNAKHMYLKLSFPIEINCNDINTFQATPKIIQNTFSECNLKLQRSWKTLLRLCPTGSWRAVDYTHCSCVGWGDQYCLSW